MEFSAMQWRDARYSARKFEADNGTSAIGKDCGWRPHKGGAAHTAAGVRKPSQKAIHHSKSCSITSSARVSSDRGVSDAERFGRLETHD
jgi:hypothetical protein